MYRLSAAMRRAAGLLAASGPRPARAVFHPFSSQDEDDLVRVIQTRPQHVLRHVRQHVWRSRKRELHFRHTVTHLMILLQDFLRTERVTPAHASAIMEGVLEECVRYAQHDMAHLLFRAFLRFRKYGCTISVHALRSLFESYKSTDSTGLMLQLAQEMRGDAALRPLCMAAYLFAQHVDEAEALRAGLSLGELTKEDLLALLAGYDRLDRVEGLAQVLEAVETGSLPLAERAEVLGALLRVWHRRDDDAAFAHALAVARAADLPLDAEVFATILRQQTRRATSPAEIARVEAELQATGYTPDATGQAILITAYARLLHLGDRGEESIMLAKVDTLLAALESRLRQGDPDMDVSAAHIRAVLRGYGAAGKTEALTDAWDRLQCEGVTNDVRVYNELLKWLALRGNVKEVLARKEAMERAGIHADAGTYTWVFRALGRYYPRQVERLYEELLAHRVRCDVPLYNTLLGLFGDLGREDVVESLVAEMRSREAAGTLEWSALTYAVLLRVWARDTPRVRQLYAEAKERHLADHPHVRTSLLHALVTYAEDEAAVEAVLAELPTWDTEVYNILLHKYGRAHQVERVEELLAKMKAEDVAMNEVTFGTLLSTFARWGEAGRVTEVLELLKAHEGSVSASFYSVLASSLSRMGDVGGVDEAWEDLLASRLPPDTEVYNRFLALYGRHHNLDKMQGVLDRMMRQVPANPVTATTVLDTLGKSGRVAEMESLFEDMKSTPDTRPTSVTFHQMMNTYAKTGDVAKMDRLHAEFLEAGHANGAVTYNILMDGYGRAKDFERMEETRRRRTAAGIAMDDFAYCILIAAYGRARAAPEVQRLLDELTAEDQPDHPGRTQRVLWCLIDAFCRCGHVDAMEACVAKMQLYHPDTARTATEAAHLIPFYCRLGHMEAVERLEAQLNGDPSYTLLNAIARGYARAGRLDKTVETLHKLRDRKWVPDAATALHLSGTFLRAGLPEQAQQIVEWRRQYAKCASDHTPPSTPSKR